MMFHSVNNWDCTIGMIRPPQKPAQNFSSFPLPQRSMAWMASVALVASLLGSPALAATSAAKDQTPPTQLAPSSPAQPANQNTQPELPPRPGTIHGEGATTTAAPAPNQPATSQQGPQKRFGWNRVITDLTKRLDADQHKLSEIYNLLETADPAPTGFILSIYMDKVSTLRGDVQSILGKLQSYNSAIKALLDILGPTPQPGEAPTITAQRAKALQNATAFKALTVQAKLCELETSQLKNLLSSLTNHIQQATLSHRDYSPLGLAFWRNVWREGQDALQSMQYVGILHSVIILPLGLLLALVGSNLLGRVLVKYILRFLLRMFGQTVPEATPSGSQLPAGASSPKAGGDGDDQGTAKDDQLNQSSPPPHQDAAGSASDKHPRPSSKAVPLNQLTPGQQQWLAGWQPLAALVTGIACALMACLFWLLWNNLLLPSPMVLTYTVTVSLPACAFVLGAGIPLSQWHHGQSTRILSLYLGCELMGYAMLNALQNQEIIGQSLAGLFSGIVALIGAVAIVLLGRTIVRNGQSKTSKPSQEGSTSSPSTHESSQGHDRAAVKLPALPPSPLLRKTSHINFRKPLYALCVLVFTLTAGAVATGYITFAYVLNGIIIDFIYAISVTGVLAGAWQTAVRELLNPSFGLGKWICSIGVSPRHLKQFEVLLGAFGSLALIIVLIALLQTHGDLSLAVLWERMHHIFIGTSGAGVDISPEKIVICLTIIVGTHYFIAYVRDWLENRFFPTTNLEMGARTSIISILAYMIWIGMGLTVLSMLGLSVQNLTWVVSALSVGVGFGLQSIVKDFISGLILLAERPMQPGDIININGKSGEVRRVNIRATDITLLGDGSTLIVPNSQFISSDVNNASFGGLPSRMALNFTFSASTDLDQARQVLMDAMNDQELILAFPAPVVPVTHIGDMEVVLTAAFWYATARDATGIQTALLGDVFKRFHALHINVSMH
ncbi:mechanosensitive ion channel [Formicincola oecophyllae]|uniref:Mechanosensitive ion channel n=1 Tax=Formicincola oecophyllae TaxID=2558361 RepID=A0A4Y6U8X5_9PROT|nr:DUF3772 domain-containing protein [Formicincola oecophyllae]QDH13654.1 mechanosensitive ion channel [Formicincola oecophyllae]